MKKSLAIFKCMALLFLFSLLCGGCSGLSTGSKETVLEEASAWEESAGSEEGLNASTSVQNSSAANTDTADGANGTVGNDSGDSGSLQNISEIIYVEVCGEVESPGVYRLAGNSRVYQAIEMAGGMTKKAALGSVNQAELLADGQQIYVPSKSEVENGTQIASAAATAGNTSSAGSSSSNASGASSASGNTDLVNINTASEEELMNLSGIGEARAEAIVKYRESNGNFTCIEDLMNVSGIGSGIYSKVMDQITV